LAEFHAPGQLSDKKPSYFKSWNEARKKEPSVTWRLPSSKPKVQGTTCEVLGQFKVQVDPIRSLCLDAACALDKD
jgi:hypothetical protein